LIYFAKNEISLQMKKLLITTLTNLLFCIAAFSQDVLVTTSKIGPFALGQKLAEVEKIAAKKIDKKLIEKSFTEIRSTIKLTVDSIEYELAFSKEYDNKGNDTKNYIVQSIFCKNQRVKTKSGMALGWNKFDVLKRLESLNTDFEYRKMKKYSDDGKTQTGYYESICIFDGVSGKVLYFTIENNVITEFQISYDEGC
jgi:hypothetical protein